MDLIFILAGGLGTRLQSVVKDIPKPMADIAGKPFLTFQIDQIKQHFPASKIVLLTHHLSEVIESYFQNDPQITCLKETKLLGTGGAIKQAISHLKLPKSQSFLVFNGDTYTEVNLSAFVNTVAQNVAMVVCKQENCDRFGTVQFENGILTAFQEKKEGVRQAYINAGIYCFKTTEFFDKLSNGPVSLELALETHVKTQPIAVFTYEGPFIDIGIPEDYFKMQAKMT